MGTKEGEDARKESGGRRGKEKVKDGIARKQGRGEQNLESV